jgi:ubiquinone/menaquinone biosynthesis C-methylase UbiE
MTQAAVQSNITPQQITDHLWAARGALSLIAGIELDLFTHIAAGNRTAKEIARAAQANERGVGRLLDALVGLGYLDKKGGRYGLEPISERFLVRNGQAYLGNLVYESKLTLPGWMRLSEVVKSGRPVKTVDHEEQGREFFPKLVTAIFPLSYSAARAVVASLLGKARARIKTILDVAAGSGAWSLPFAQALPSARVTVLDFPEVTPTARQYAERLGVAAQYDYVEGNLRQVDFGRSRYDLVILGHIIHSEGEKWGQRLVKKSYRALKDGGLLLIAEMIPNDTRTGPVMPLLFSLNMLLHTEHGDVFTMREYRQWLKKAGFKKIKTIEAPAPSPLILATK